jgi:hypothetical protein
VVQPLVLAQLRTGQKSSYLASHASHILDMDEALAKAIYALMKTFAHEPFARGSGTI